VQPCPSSPSQLLYVCHSIRLPLHVSSTQVDAEKAAWEVAQAAGLDLVTILPNFVLGPVVNPGCAGVSIGFMKVGGGGREGHKEDAGGRGGGHKEG
jgi:hypothetical protein